VRRRVVILDSDPTFGQSLQKDFDSRDFDVEIVGTPAQAVASIAASLPALVVLDVHLPEEAALRLLRIWQQQAPDLVVILVSGKASLHVVIKAMQEGGRRFFAKPVSVGALLDAIEAPPRALPFMLPVNHQLGTAALDTAGVDRFFAISPGLLSISGFDGYFKMLNPAWIKALGYTIDELCERPHLELVHPDDREKARDEAFDIRGGHTVFIYKNRYRRKDGEYRWLEWHATPSPEHRLVYASARDVTKTVRMEEGLRETNARLKGSVASHETQLRASEEKNDLLAELGRAKDEASDLIVHDLKNPLSVIIANYDYLVDGFEGSAESLEALQDSKTAGQRMLRLLENLLDVTHLENGSLKVCAVSVDIRALLSTLVDQRRILGLGHGITLSFLPGAPLTITIDQDLVTRAIENIFDNAFRHTPPQGRVEVQLTQVGTDIEIRIGNSGRAIPVDMREAIFDKHRQAHDDSARLNLGLGLYFCRLAITVQGGAMWVEETELLPTVFGIRLPCVPAPKSGAATN
jgi:PAS domain S-box-containing protein